MSSITSNSTSGRRAIYLMAGWICVALGIIGAVLPVMPTTCFLIAALWCFSRSSPVLAQKLLSHRRFGPPLRQWQAHRAIPVQAKVVAVSSMVVSWGVVVVTSQSGMAPLMVGVILSPIVLYILTRPSTP